MTVARIEAEAVKLLQLLDALQIGGRERAFAVESVENDAFEEVAESQVMIIGKGPQHFQDALFHANTSLNAFDDVFWFGAHGLWYQCTVVTESFANLDWLRGDDGGSRRSFRG